MKSNSVNGFDKILQILYDAKKYFLIAEYYDRKTAYETEQKWAKITQNMKVETEFEARLVAESVKDILENCAIDAYVGDSGSSYHYTIDKLLNGDYDVYTHRHHGNAFWNEIPLPKIIEVALEKACEVYGIECNPIFKYELRLYDMSDYAISFETENKLNEFVNKNDVAPASAFYILGGCGVEMWTI